MRTQHTIPMARANCETCGWHANRGSADWSERVQEVRTAAIQHATKNGHDVFVEKNTGSLYKGTDR